MAAVQYAAKNRLIKVSDRNGAMKHVDVCHYLLKNCKGRLNRLNFSDRARLLHEMQGLIGIIKSIIFKQTS